MLQLGTRHIDAAKDGVWISENYKTFDGKVKRINLQFQLADSFRTAGYSKQVMEIEGGATFIADEFNGLKRRNPGDNDYFNTDLPEGPTTHTSFDVYARNKELWVAHGGYDERWIYTYNRAGFSQFKDEKWKPYKMFEYPPFGDSTFDFVKIVKGPDGNVYAGSNQSGLFVLKADGSYEIFKQGYFDESAGAGGTYRVSGLAFDKQGNLWMNVFGGTHELVVKMKDGNWYEYFVPYSRIYPHSAAHLIIDDNGQKWWASPRGGGVIAYDDNGTPDNIADDRHRHLVAGKGSGGLPDNEVFVLAKDQNNSIWIGTANGIGIVACSGSVITGDCESELRVVQFDEFAGYLFQNEQVHAIAVDGGNRKWIGTTNGVWLVSPEGDEILMRFTAENSPLPSNNIQTISIDQVTGDVYISTEEGLVSFRGTATEGGSENKDVVTFPNPVPSGFNGTIAITGLVENADVRITDISGQLVHRMRANGGQATWDGKDYTGRRPQSGVYLIFVTNRDGSQTHAGKMVFME
ncbi:MAG: Two component regulator propeller [Flavipsychrobacter sp.]|nr:Two component regulator propeller [Flavipsychrobacter sp.]